MEISAIENKFNKLIIHPEFNQTIKDLAKKTRDLPRPTFLSNDSDYISSTSSPKLKILGDRVCKVKCNPLKGRQFFEKQTIQAYDESLAKYNALEGVAFLTCHSLILVGERYLPANYVTFYFYTQSNLIKGDSNVLRYSKNPELDSKKDYYHDRMKLFMDYVQKDSILLIDGPLIAGDAYVVFIKDLHKLLDKNICTVFFIKNSGGNIITENITEYKGDYNNDLHWANMFLNQGERTSLFEYQDEYNKENSRVFCFIKAYNASPQRIEFHLDTYKKFKRLIEDILDMVYYLLLVQGEIENPQIRPIAIAEMYARESLKLFDINKMLKNAGVKPTMNQVRFG